MSDTTAHEALIQRLSTTLQPTSKLAAPWLRTAIWLGAVALVALPLAMRADARGLAARLLAAPDMWLSQAGAMLTALLAAWAAFQSGIPGRSPSWALLPLPPALLWVGASTAGCLRLRPIPGALPEPHMHAAACLQFIVLIALPLAAVLAWLLLRAYALRPGITALLAGLASAAAAASLLALIHPFDATAEDLGVHFLAVLAVLGIVRLVGGRILR